MEVGFGNQAPKLVPSLEVSISRSHSPTRGQGPEHPTRPRRPTRVPKGRCERRGRRPRRVLPSRTCRRPNLGTVGRRRKGPLPRRRRSRHLHGERYLLLRAHHVPQRGVEKRGGEKRRGPPGRAARRARPGHAGLPPTRPLRRRRERPRGAARSGQWASARGCLLRSAPPRPACLSRARLTWGAEKGAGGGGGEGGEEEGGRRGGEGGGRGRRQRDAPLAAAAARPRLSGPGESGGPRREGGGAGGAARAGTCKLQCPWPRRSAPCPARATAAAEFFTTPQSATAGATLGLAPGRGDPSRGGGWGRGREARGRARRSALWGGCYERASRAQSAPGPGGVGGSGA